MKYSDIKNEIYGYYKHMGNIDIDNITDVNDHIIDEHLSAKRFEDSLEEFYITVAMCSFMVEHNLYDEYFFDAYSELIDEFNKTSALLNNIEDELKQDIDVLNEHVKKDKMMSEYYDNLSNVYNNQFKNKKDNK